MMESELETRRKALYSSQRHRHANEIRNTLLQSSVLREGEYNFNILKEKDGVWNTWTKSDYRSPKPLVVAENKPKANAIGHLKTHFEFGKHGEELSNSLYQTSRTQEDYVTQKIPKPPVHEENRTVNWPDMAPQYAVERDTGNSEYNNAFLGAALPPSTPAYPRINTSRLMTPASDNRDFKFNSKVNVQLGSDLGTYASETQCSYDTPGGDSSKLLGVVNTATDISSNMRKMARESSVFRSGDYNNITQEPGSIFTLDYGKKLSTPSTFKIDKRKSNKEKDAIKEEEDPEEDEDKPPMPKMIGRFLKEERNNVIKDAIEGKEDHNSAHFLFGTDGYQPRSVYAKDFGKDSRINTAVRFQPAPPSSQVLQYDPEQSGTGKSTIKDTHAEKTFTMAAIINADQRNLGQLNMHRRYGTNVVLSYDQSRHQNDRQNSLSHSSYLPPPSEFQAMRPRTTPKPAYNYIVTDVALPFSVNKQKESEAQNQYRGFSMDAESSSRRQLDSRDQTTARRDWGWGTHFINGYEPKRFYTENRDLFSGRSKDVVDPPAAGKTEQIPDSKFTHFNISDNTQDMKPSPDRTDVMSALHQKQQAVGRSLPALPVHNASLMANDYQPLYNRMYTPAQILMMRQSEVLKQKNIEKTHLFHTDAPGNKNFQTTTMADFIKPEVMTPRAMTSVR